MYLQQRQAQHRLGPTDRPGHALAARCRSKCTTSQFRSVCRSYLPPHYALAQVLIEQVAYSLSPAQILIDQAPSLFVLPPCHPCHTGAHRQIPVRPLPLHSSRSIPPPPPLPPAPLAYRYSSTRSRTARCATSCSLASRALRWRWGGGSTGGQMLWGLRQDTLIFTGGRIPSSSR